jgi:beta-RFAP synthase
MRWDKPPGQTEEITLNRAAARLPASVTVSAPARLHLGFLDLHGGLGRRFGSIGLAIDGLSTRLTISHGAQTQVEGPAAERVRRYHGAMRRRLGLDWEHQLKIEETMPAHAGLGSGTQLALAVAAGLRRLHGLPLDLAGDATALGRGARSGIGIGVFEGGGLVVDGGRGAGDTPAPVIARLPFPQHWRVIVVLDHRRQGVHGRDELAAFAALPPFPAHDAAHLCRLLVMQALPAAAEGDLAVFGAAIEQMQARLGDYFAPVQGGRFTSPQVGAVLARLAREGGAGIGQSSWGPTGFAFAASPEEAEHVAAVARAYPDSRALDIRVCAALNRGADMTVQMDAEGQD